MLALFKRLLHRKPVTAQCRICDDVFPEDEGAYPIAADDESGNYFVCRYCADALQNEGLEEINEDNEEPYYERDLSGTPW